MRKGTIGNRYLKNLVSKDPTIANTGITHNNMSTCASCGFLIFLIIAAIKPSQQTIPMGKPKPQRLNWRISYKNGVESMYWVVYGTNPAVLTISPSLKIQPKNSLKDNIA